IHAAPYHHTHHSVLAFSPPLLRPPPRSPLFPYTTLFRSTACAPRTSPTCACAASCATRCPCSSCAICRCASASNWPASCAMKARSEEHTSELQSRENLVCRLLLEKKKKPIKHTHTQQQPS